MRKRLGAAALGQCAPGGAVMAWLGAPLNSPLDAICHFVRDASTMPPLSFNASERS